MSKARVWVVYALALAAMVGLIGALLDATTALGVAWLVPSASMAIVAVGAAWWITAWLTGVEI